MTPFQFFDDQTHPRIALRRQSTHRIAPKIAVCTPLHTDRLNWTLLRFSRLLVYAKTGTGGTNIMNNLEHIVSRAEQQCKQNGTQLTAKRKTVLTGLLQSQKALSAYELTDYCSKELGETLPTMSVYRILDFLESEQLVHKLNIANRYVACIHIACDHKHAVPQFLICTNCQQVKEISISNSTVATLKKNVENAGYTLASPQLEMNCLCERCARLN